MTLTHDTIRLNRAFDAPVSRVFAAWVQTEALEDWCTPGDDNWSSHVRAHDFRVGGEKTITFGPTGETPYVEQSHYLDIAADRHIINSERILRGEELISVSKIILEFAGAGTGCRLSVTDQITLLTDGDSPEQRRTGWGEVLDRLQVYLADGR